MKYKYRKTNTSYRLQEQQIKVNYQLNNNNAFNKLNVKLHRILIMEISNEIQTS